MIISYLKRDFAPFRMTKIGIEKKKTVIKIHIITVFFLKKLRET